MSSWQMTHNRGVGEDFLVRLPFFFNGNDRNLGTKIDPKV